MNSGCQRVQVTLQIPKSFCHYYALKDERISVEALPGETAADLIKRTGLPEFEFGIVVVNGERQLPSYQPRDGETLELLPIISGG